MKKSNLLLTQPNEYLTRNYLVQYTQKGEFICSYDFLEEQEELHSGPIDVAYLPKSKTRKEEELLVLFFMDGFFLVDKFGKIKRKYGKGGPEFGELMFGMDIDKEGNVYFINVGTNEKRNPRIMKYNANEEFEDIFAQECTTPTRIKCVDDGVLISFGAPNVQIKKYDYNGTLINYYNAPQEEEIKYFSGITETDENLLVLAEGIGDTNDYIGVFEKKQLKLVSKIELNQQGATPTNIIRSNDQKMFYVLNSDPWSSNITETEHVHAYSEDFTFIHSFGGHECKELCQTFVGILEIK